MSVLLLAAEFLVVMALVGYLSNHYGNWKKQHVAVTMVTFVAWYVSMLIICTLPIDVSMTYYRRCLSLNLEPLSPSTANTSSSSSYGTGNESQGSLQSSDINKSTLVDCKSPWMYVDRSFLSYFWHVVYWTSQALTWLILPIMQSYAKAGNFTVMGKLRASVIDNAIYYGTYLVIFIVIFIYIIVKRQISLDFGNLKVILITASNTWGLFLVIVFLGYGLVEVPRSVWRAGDTEASLRQAYFRLSNLSVERAECEEELEDALREVKRLSISIPPSHPLRHNMEIIIAKSSEVDLPGASGSNSGARSGVSRGEDGEGDSPSEKALIRLHTNLKSAQQRHVRAQAVWREAVNKAAWLEDVENNRGSRVREFRAGHCEVPEEGDFLIPLCVKLRDWWQSSSLSDVLEWYWKCQARPLLLKFWGLFLLGVSVFVVWSECTFFVQSPTLSLFARLIQLAARNFNFFSIVLVSFCTIGYLSLAVYFTVFRLRIFNYFHLVPNHQTDENSLIFSGMLVCRLTPPLCLNYLGVIHMDSHVLQGRPEESGALETSYTGFMGHLDVIPFIASGFNVYFPMAVVLLCGATYFRLGARCLHHIGFDQFIDSADETTQVGVEEGRALLKRERQAFSRRNRVLERECGGSSSRRYEPAGQEMNAAEEGEINRGLSGDDYRPARGSGGRSGPSDRLGKNSDRARLLDFVDPVEYSEEAVQTYLDRSITKGGRPAQQPKRYRGFGDDRGGFFDD